MNGAKFGEKEGRGNEINLITKSLSRIIKKSVAGGHEKVQIKSNDLDLSHVLLSAHKSALGENNPMNEEIFVM